MILGITGAFGSGKSTLLALFKEAGFRSMSADAICARLYEERDSVLCDGLRRRFGAVVFASDGAPDRKALAKIVFAEDSALDDLEALLLPRVRSELESAVAEARRNGFDLALEIPLLYEGGFEKICDRVVVLYCDEALRRERLKARGFAAAEVAQRDRRQLPAREKLERADFGLVNNGSRELLATQVKTMLSEIKIITRKQE